MFCLRLTKITDSADSAANIRLNKLKESQEQNRRKQQLPSKMQVLLFRHKELLKKDILKRRAMLEKELQIDVQVSTLTDNTQIQLKIFIIQ